MRVCPCCGYRAMRAGLCDVCAWEEHGPHELRAAQRCFVETQACDPSVRAFARPPREDEERPAWWATLDDTRVLLVRLVEEAFAGVRLDGGVSLEEAELIDSYALPARTELDPPPRGYGDGPPWEALTTEALARFPWGNFAFQDARGIRYHLPAYVRAHLREGKAPGAVDSLLFILQSGHQLEALQRLLTPAQAQVVARYLAWVALDGSYDAIGASRALARWEAFLDPDQRAQLVSGCAAP